MNFEKLYKPCSKKTWHGRSDESAEGNQRWHHIVKRLDLSEASFTKKEGKKHDLEKLLDKSKNFAFIGFECDEGVRRNQGRVGAKEAPDEIRAAMVNFPVHFDKAIKLFDAGNISCEPDDLENAQEALAEAVHRLISHGYFPIVLGGGHETAYGHYMGLHKTSKEKIGIINFDAHFDLRPLVDGKLGSSGTPFLQIANQCKKTKVDFDYLCLGINKNSNTAALFETAKKLKVTYKEAHEIGKVKNTIDKFLEKNQKIYLSNCLDVFSASIAPGVSAPSAMGIMHSDFIPAFEQIIKSGKVISLDIVELCPRLDIDKRTAKLAAAIIFRFIELNQMLQ